MPIALCIAASTVPHIDSTVSGESAKQSMMMRASSVTRLGLVPPARSTRTNRAGNCRGIFADTTAYTPNAVDRIVIAVFNAGCGVGCTNIRYAQHPLIS